MVVNIDAVNASLRAGSIVFLVLNCVKIYRDRRIAGVSVWPTLYAGCVACWSAAYYSWLDQWRSSLVMFGHGVVELAWVAMVAWFLFFRRT
jgi:hypothetical protein